MSDSGYPDALYAIGAKRGRKRLFMKAVVRAGASEGSGKRGRSVILVVAGNYSDFMLAAFS